MLLYISLDTLFFLLMITIFFKCLLYFYFYSFTQYRFEIPGMEAFRMSPENKKIPGFRYFGEGLDKGVCGVTIDSIKANFNGLAKCNLGTLEDEEFSGFIEIIVAREYTIFRNQFFFGCRKTKHFQGFLTISIVGVFAQFSGVTIVVVA